MHTVIALVAVDLNRRHRLDMLMYAWMVATRQSRVDRTRAEQFHNNVFDLLLDWESEKSETNLGFVKHEMMYYDPQFLFEQRHTFGKNPWINQSVYRECLKAALIVEAALADFM